MKFSSGTRTLVQVGREYSPVPIAEAIRASLPGHQLIILLVESRALPHEFGHLAAEVTALPQPASAEVRISVAEQVFERARGSEAVLFIDSLTRLARTYNELRSEHEPGHIIPSGIVGERIAPLKALFVRPHTVVGTVAIDTGSRMDEVVYLEFKSIADQDLALPR